MANPARARSQANVREPNRTYAAPDDNKLVCGSETI